MPEGWDRLAIDAQAGSGASMLGHFRYVLAARRRLMGRLPDRIEWVKTQKGVLSYTRGPLTVACNFASRPVRLHLDGKLTAGSDPLVRLGGGTLSLPPNSAVWVGPRQ
jgi:hypothetical protein